LISLNDTAEVRERSGIGAGLSVFARRRELIPFILLVVVFIASWSLSDSFHDPVYILQAASRYMELGMCALIMTMIITAGMIDLSIPAIMSCSAMLTGVVYHSGQPMGVAIFLGVVTGVGCGALNGLLIAYAGLPSIIVTIGTMNVFRGIAQIFIGDKSLGEFPEWFNSVEKIPLFSFGQKGVFGITVFIFLIMAVLSYILLHRTSFGRHVFAIGANEKAAVYSGVDARRTKMTLFMLSGGVAAFAGIITMSRLLLVRFDMQLNTEIDMVVMALLGGADINGGRGSILGTFFAIVMVILLKTGLIVANVTADQQMFIMGLILLVSIIIPNIGALIQARKDK
jgi:rhamnose transport system permease protein